MRFTDIRYLNLSLDPTRASTPVLPHSLPGMTFYLLVFFVVIDFLAHFQCEWATSSEANHPDRGHSLRSTVWAEPHRLSLPLLPSVTPPFSETFHPLLVVFRPVGSLTPSATTLDTFHSLASFIPPLAFSGNGHHRSVWYSFARFCLATYVTHIRVLLPAHVPTYLHACHLSIQLSATHATQLTLQVDPTLPTILIRPKSTQLDSPGLTKPSISTCFRPLFVHFQYFKTLYISLDAYLHSLKYLDVMSSFIYLFIVWYI